MFILGLTGSIGMGKSTAAAQLRFLGLPVHDADAAVHALMAPGGAAVAAVGAAFPGVVGDGAVDRRALGAQVFDDDAALQRLEAILHPLVRESEHRFLAACARRRADLVVLDIPLLFETGGDARCDAVLVVHCRAALQRRRVLARPGMTEARFRAILARQVPARQKVRLADFAVNTGIGKHAALRRLAAVVTLVRGCKGRVWAPSSHW
ncbi:MAG: dephospho-CoA kinase [Rhodospirillales bacterium CG15_BIG_FIL_POST_REV_8_21_14_020_66_15]|nr:MAG: dephospho-CoA kinase [Rhodospirillales bacterium CG15_BIG_FIL_POST_REV_8_21_14_020_66_15]